MSVTIRLACGHTPLVLDDSASAPPVCPACQERRVSQVIVTRLPRFRGSVLGPCAAYDPSGGAVVVNVAPGGSLPLKPLKEM